MTAPTPFYLHYIGGRVYASADRFIREAKAQGVARAVPKEFLTKMRWGATVLLGQWKRNDGQPPKGKDLQGTANVFGYTHITGVNIQTSAPARAYINRRLHIEKVDDLSSNPPEVERACGSYSIGSVAWVTDDLYQIARIAIDAERETGDKVRLFFTGAFEDVNPNVSLNPVGFTRTFRTVFLQSPSWAPFEDTKDRVAPVAYLLDYASRRYIPKDVRERLYGEIIKDVVP